MQLKSPKPPTDPMGDGVTEEDDQPAPAEAMADPDVAADAEPVADAEPAADEPVEIDFAEASDPADVPPPADEADDLSLDETVAEPAADDDAPPIPEESAEDDAPADGSAKADQPAAAEPQVAADAMRIWTDNSGKYQVRARLVSVADGKVRLLKENGHFTTVPFQRLSSADLAFAQRQAPALAKTGAQPKAESSQVAGF